jgi:hypothetical protein
VRIKVRPVNERQLQGKPRPEQPDRDSGPMRGVQGHVQVSRHDGDEQRDEAPGCGWLGCGEEKPEASEHLRCAAELHQKHGGRQVRRHDVDVDGRDEEVKDTGDEEEDGEDRTGLHTDKSTETGGKCASIAAGDHRGLRQDRRGDWDGFAGEGQKKGRPENLRAAICSLRSMGLDD